MFIETIQYDFFALCQIHFTISMWVNFYEFFIYFVCCIGAHSNRNRFTFHSKNQPTKHFRTHAICLNIPDYRIFRIPSNMILSTLNIEKVKNRHHIKFISMWSCRLSIGSSSNSQHPINSERCCIFGFSLDVHSSIHSVFFKYVESLSHERANLYVVIKHFIRIQTHTVYVYNMYLCIHIHNIASPISLEK